MAREAAQEKSRRGGHIPWVTARAAAHTSAHDSAWALAATAAPVSAGVPALGVRHPPLALVRGQVRVAKA